MPFPYTAGDTVQRRPALVVASTGPGGDLALLWVLMITSAENRSWPGDVEITDLNAAGLPVKSVVRTAKIATVEAARTSVAGRLSLEDRGSVAGALRMVLSPALEP